MALVKSILIPSSTELCNYFIKLLHDDEALVLPQKNVQFEMKILHIPDLQNSNFSACVSAKGIEFAKPQLEQYFWTDRQLIHDFLLNFIEQDDYYIQYYRCCSQLSSFLLLQPVDFSYISERLINFNQCMDYKNLTISRCIRNFVEGEQRYNFAESSLGEIFLLPKDNKKDEIILLRTDRLLKSINFVDKQFLNCELFIDSKKRIQQFLDIIDEPFFQRIDYAQTFITADKHIAAVAVNHNQFITYRMEVDPQNLALFAKSNFCFVDFEFNLRVSQLINFTEFGAARMQNGVLVATMRCQLIPDWDLLNESKQFKNTYCKDGRFYSESQYVASPTVPDYMSMFPVFDSELFRNVFHIFSSGSSIELTQLQQLIKQLNTNQHTRQRIDIVQICKSFDNEYCQFCSAKGVDAETVGFHQLNINQDIIEASQVFKQVDSNFEYRIMTDIHEQSRVSHRCEFHRQQKLLQKHCAGDDARYLAQRFEAFLCERKRLFGNDE